MKRYILFLLFINFVIIGCEKQNIEVYNEKSRIYFSINRDSITDARPGSYATNILMDFSSLSSSIQTDTLIVPVLISGETTDFNRSFDVEIDGESTTMIENEDFKLLNSSFQINKDEYASSIELVLFRSPNIKRETKVLKIKLNENDEFQLGPQSDTISTRNYKATEFVVRTKDVVVKPINWDSFILEYFGEYSEVKHRFVIDVLDRSEIPSSTTPSTMRNYKNRLIDALNAYNDMHDEVLKDEHGQIIDFN